LLADDADDRSRGCDDCGHRVLNLDVLPVAAVLQAFDDRAHWFKPCVHASAAAGRVLFLRDARAVPPATTSGVDGDGRVPIRTARSLATINRAAGMGYWPDVRWLQPKTELLEHKRQPWQHAITGRVTAAGDFRAIGPARGFQTVCSHVRPPLSHPGYTCLAAKIELPTRCQRSGWASTAWGRSSTGICSKWTA
jgi:hypothetical protein